MAAGTVCDDEREGFLLVISRGLEGGNPAPGQSLANNYVNLQKRGQSVDNAFVQTKVRMETINPQHVGTEDMKRDSWDERKGEADTKTSVRYMKRKKNCYDSLCSQKD